MGDRLRVLVTKKLFAADVDYIRERLDERVELVWPVEYTPDGIAAACDDAVDVLFGGLVKKEWLDRCPNLRLVQVPWTGVDSLDFELLRRYDVAVANSHSSAQVVAE